VTVAPISDLANVTAIMQTALTPAFLLVAIGTLLNIFVIRLSRIVDRSRELQLQYIKTKGKEHELVVNELRIVTKRMATVNTSILLSVLSTIAVCVIIGMLFMMGLAGFAMAKAIVATFMIALLLTASSLLFFVREVQLANQNIRVRAEFLQPSGIDVD
jgi:ABC-type siderophore export system fused ATPase/permease subunit